MTKFFIAVILVSAYSIPFLSAAENGAKQNTAPAFCLACVKGISEAQLQALEVKAKGNPQAGCSTILMGCLRSMGTHDCTEETPACANGESCPLDKKPDQAPKKCIPVNYGLTPEVIGCASDYGCYPDKGECKIVHDVCKVAKGASLEALTCAVNLGCDIPKEQCGEVTDLCLRKKGRATCAKWNYVCADGRPCAPGNESVGTRNCAVNYEYEATKKSDQCIKQFHCT